LSHDFVTVVKLHGNYFLVCGSTLTNEQKRVISNCFDEVKPLIKSFLLLVE